MGKQEDRQDFCGLLGLHNKTKSTFVYHKSVDL